MDRPNWGLAPGLGTRQLAHVAFTSTQLNTRRVCTNNYCTYKTNIKLWSILILPHTIKPPPQLVSFLDVGIHHNHTVHCRGQRPPPKVRNFSPLDCYHRELRAIKFLSLCPPEGARHHTVRTIHQVNFSLAILAVGFLVNKRSDFSSIAANTYHICVCMLNSAIL